MSKTGQSEGRNQNGAIPPGKPDAATSTEAVRKAGRMSQTRAGPDGPGPAEVGDTIKRQGA